MKHAVIEITEGLILKISAHGEVGQVVAKAALNPVGAQLLYDALGEYLGLKARSTGRGHTTMFAGEDLTAHQTVLRKAATVRLKTPPGGVVRLRSGGRAP